jgi:hypothetical protein
LGFLTDRQVFRCGRPVHFRRGDDQSASGRRVAAQRLEQIQLTANVQLIGCPRLVPACPDIAPGRQVKDKVRTYRRDNLIYPGQVAQIAVVQAQPFSQWPNSPVRAVDCAVNLQRLRLAVVQEKIGQN